jgi:hypothetical protein
MVNAKRAKVTPKKTHMCLLSFDARGMDKLQDFKSVPNTRAQRMSRATVHTQRDKKSDPGLGWWLNEREMPSINFHK